MLPSAKESWLESFQTMYQNLDHSNLQQLDEWYLCDAIFEDPLQRHEGLAAIKTYFSHLYQNVTDVEFEYLWHVQQSAQLVIGWQMRYRHPRLNHGQTISVDGVTQLQLLGDKIKSHRDYFDVGAMLYEQIPLLGRAVCWVKQRAKG